MAARSKKRLSKNENKFLKLDKLELKDVLCTICQSILIEPVSLPCFHVFCQSCFNGSIENNALCCPLCRLRIGSWLRTATKQKNLVNVELWNHIKSKFPGEILIKSKGEDLHLPEEQPVLRLSEPGEIRLEYETEISRLRAERLRLEQKHIQETELLIKKLQNEEEEAHKKYLESLKQDEILAQQMQKEQTIRAAPSTPRKQTIKIISNQHPRFRPMRIESYLAKRPLPTIKDSPLLTDDNTSTDSSTPKMTSVQTVNGASPEMVPTYGKLMKNALDRKNKLGPGLWNKENGDRCKDKKEEPSSLVEKDKKADKPKTKTQPSLLVSLPLPFTGILQHKVNAIENRNVETSSVDSMQQELCYFKPIEGTTPTSFHTNKGLPLRVPSVRATQESSPLMARTPSRAQFVDGLCQLRKMSLNLPSAFVIALNILRVKKESPSKCGANPKPKFKKTKADNRCTEPVPTRKNSNRHKQNVHIEGITKLNKSTNLRRTRSMGSITKDENETTPKKAKTNRKVSSERKPYLRSDKKKSNAKKVLNTPPLTEEPLNNNKVNLAVKNLSSPMQNCDVKKILEEQLRIEKLIEQEKKDLELARKVDAEWNSRRQLRRVAVKRQVTLNESLRPAKKLKV